MKYQLLFILFLFTSCNWIVSSSTNSNQKTSTTNSNEYRIVKRVVDGDTFVMEDGEKIRLIGINAPEVGHNGEPEMPFGEEAKKYLKEKITGQKVRLEFDVDEKDVHGRTLAYAYLEDGTFINEDLVRNGWARAKSYPPNTSKQDILFDAQEEAKKEKRNIWSK